MVFEEIKGTPVFQFEKKGDSIEGTYKGPTEGKFGEDYIIETKTGDQTVFGKTVLNTKMKNVPQGVKIKIVYNGEIKAETGGRMYQDYSVFVDK